MHQKKEEERNHINSFSDWLFFFFLFCFTFSFLVFLLHQLLPLLNVEIWNSVWCSSWLPTYTNKHTVMHCNNTCCTAPFVLSIFYWTPTVCDSLRSCKILLYHHLVLPLFLLPSTSWLLMLCSHILLLFFSIKIIFSL